MEIEGKRTNTVGVNLFLYDRLHVFVYKLSAVGPDSRPLVEFFLIGIVIDILKIKGKKRKLKDTLFACCFPIIFCRKIGEMLREMNRLHVGRIDLEVQFFEHFNQLVASKSPG